MKVIVDQDLCEANGLCMQEAPAVFVVDETNRMVVLQERPAPEHAGDVRSAVKHCPRGALSLVDD